MPNNTPTCYTLVGLPSLQEAAYQELLKSGLFNPCATKQPYHDTLRVHTDSRHLYWACHTSTVNTTHTLTLPQDWDQFMAILEGLKQPKVPEYVKYSHRHEEYVGKVHSTSTNDRMDFYEVYNVYGITVDWVQTKCTPIAEKEFIQGGLKELAEAGFVPGTAIRSTILHSESFRLEAVRYASLTHPASICSHVALTTVKDQGFAFCLCGEYNEIPVGQCTLLPKTQTFPVTSQGIPYVNPLGRDKIYLGKVAMELNRGNVRHWLKLGVTSITLPCGTLTQEDLTTLAAL